MNTCRVEGNAEPHGKNELREIMVQTLGGNKKYETRKNMDGTAVRLNVT
jgi:hypothetical protein